MKKETKKKGNANKTHRKNKHHKKRIEKTHKQ